MAKKSMILKQQAEPKFSTRRYNRCKICGRPHAYLRDYGICRICFRELAYKGQIRGAPSTYTKYAFGSAACLRTASQRGCVLVNLVPPCCAAAARRTQSTLSPPRLA